MRLLILLSALFPAAAMGGAEPISPEEFEQIVTGKTFTYATGGIAYGAEAYLKNRRVQWTYLDGECTYGEWYVSGQDICFTYEDETIPGPQCWRFYLKDEGLAAEFTSNPLSSFLYETNRQDEPLLCLGPKVGV